MKKLLIIFSFLVFFPIAAHADFETSYNYPFTGTSFRTLAGTTTLTTNGVLNVVVPAEGIYVLYAAIYSTEPTLATTGWLTCAGLTQIVPSFVFYAKLAGTNPGPSVMEAPLYCGSAIRLVNASGATRTFGYVLHYVDQTIYENSSTTASTTPALTHEETLFLVMVLIVLLGVPFWRFLFGGWGKRK